MCEKVKKSSIIVPEGLQKEIANEGKGRLLLHACCAPCSSAIVEWLLAHDIEPIIYYFNPNIYPLEEYEIRKNESKRHAESLGIQWIEGDVESGKWKVESGKWKVESEWKRRHEIWRHDICGGLEASKIAQAAREPERGKRCEACFFHRLFATARMAQELDIQFFATTLASSRWKNLEQINAAGQRAEELVNKYPSDSIVHEPVHFWAQNWRKDGLQERRNELLKEYGFYNQTYCGCEFSTRDNNQCGGLQGEEHS